MPTTVRVGLAGRGRERQLVADSDRGGAVGPDHLARLVRPAPFGDVQAVDGTTRIRTAGDRRRRQIYADRNGEAAGSGCVNLRRAWPKRHRPVRPGRRGHPGGMRGRRNVSLGDLGRIETRGQMRSVQPVEGVLERRRRRRDETGGEHRGRHREQRRQRHHHGLHPAPADAGPDDLPEPSAAASSAMASSDTPAGVRRADSAGTDRGSIRVDAGAGHPATIRPSTSSMVRVAQAPASARSCVTRSTVCPSRLSSMSSLRTS